MKTMAEIFQTMFISFGKDEVGKTKVPDSLIKTWQSLASVHFPSVSFDRQKWTFDDGSIVIIENFNQREMTVYLVR